jgi:mono/diheme cytochrome c family protein
MRLPIPLLLLAACRCGAGRSEGGAPPGHFEAAPSLLRAVEAGDLPAAAEAARRLDGGPPTEDAGPAESGALEDLHAAAGFLVASADVEEAGDGLARVAEACGACHGIAGVAASGGPAVPDGRAPLHARAAEALWWAVVSGDPARGREVAALLATDPPRSRSGVGEAAPRVETAARAAAAGGSPADLLAVLVGACPACHGPASDAAAGAGPG